MAEKLMVILTSAPKDAYSNKRDDDFADRLSSRYTVAVIVMFAILVSMTQYVGKPITCWAPTHFHSSWKKYTNSYCWVKNTYYLPYSNALPMEGDTEQEAFKEHVKYYQWIPFILLLQAVLFYIPTLIWHAFNSKGGIDVDNILQGAHSLYKAEKADTRETILKHLVNSIDTFLKFRRTPEKFSCDMKSVISASLCRPCSRRFGNYLVILFMFSKVFYIANVLGQFFLLDKILDVRFSSYGFDIMKNGLESSHNWDRNVYMSFPRVTMCDFYVRFLGNTQRYTVQCVLPINLYNEKIYLFLWFWMAMVFILSVISFFTWFIRFLFRSDRLKFVKNHLIPENHLKTGQDLQLLHRFLDDYLKQDGAFVLRMIAHNTDAITVTEVTCGLWETWHERDLKRNIIQEEESGDESIEKGEIV